MIYKLIKLITNYIFKNIKFSNMKSKYDFLSIGTKRKYNSERVLLNTQVTYYNAIEDQIDVILMVSKSSIFIAKDNIIIR